jgi:hypothetical protein
MRETPEETGKLAGILIARISAGGSTRQAAFILFTRCIHTGGKISTPSCDFDYLKPYGHDVHWARLFCTEHEPSDYRVLHKYQLSNGCVAGSLAREYQLRRQLSARWTVAEREIKHAAPAFRWRDWGKSLKSQFKSTSRPRRKPTHLYSVGGTEENH